MNNKLKKSLKKKQEFQNILKAIPFVLYIKDIEGNIIFATDELVKITGISQEKLEKMNVKEIYAEEYWDAMKEEDLEVIKTNRILHSKKPVDIKGVTHWYKITKSPIYNLNRIKGIVVFFNNIDKEKEIEDKKSTFMATLTHDMKTPINAQNNMLNLLYDGAFGPLNDKQKEMISLTRCSNKYMKDIVENILESYKYENGSSILKPEVFDISGLINSLCKGSKGLVDEKQLKLKCSGVDEEHYIFADRFQIKRVIINFLSNAVTYGYRNTAINVDLNISDKDISLSVKNKSKHIPKYDLDNIFEKFKQTGLSNFNKASTGLGLYLSKQIIDMHGGEIYAESLEDGTCIFGFRIPVKNETMAALAKAEA